MHDDVDDFEPVVSRLHTVGQQRVERALEQRVLARAHRSRLTWLHSTKLKVAAAIAGGFMIGSVGLATAGALPGPAQDVAHTALGVLGVHVPPGHDRYNGPECGGVATHGKYVEAHPDDPAAGKSPCGKPNRAVNHPQDPGTDPSGAPGDAGRHGPPPWAGHGKAKDKGDSTTPNSPSEKPADPAEPATTPTRAAEPNTTTPVAEPTSTTLAPEPVTTTSTPSESGTSPTAESTTIASNTTAP